MTTSAAMTAPLNPAMCETLWNSRLAPFLGQVPRLAVHHHVADGHAGMGLKRPQVFRRAKSVGLIWLGGYVAHEYTVGAWDAATASPISGSRKLGMILV